MAKAEATLDQLTVTTIRTLCMDAVQKANSGHPGAPMGLAPAAYALWTRVLRHDPADPRWPDRDRFVLSNGHGWCVPKAVLLAAACRAAGIPARLGFADVRNHLSTERMRQTMQTDLFIWHGYADLWIDSKKGTNTLLMNQMLKRLIETNALDENFVKERITNYDLLKNEFIKDSDLLAEAYSGVGKERIDRLFELLKNSGSNIVFVYNVDSTSDKSINDLKTIGNFMLLTGRHGKQNNGIIVLREFNNSTGLLEMGVSPEYLPGYVHTKEENRFGTNI